MLSDAVLISAPIREVLSRALQCGGVIAHTPGETVAIKELEARCWLSPMLHLGAFKLTQCGESVARAVLSP